MRFIFKSLPEGKENKQSEKEKEKGRDYMPTSVRVTSVERARK